MSKLTLFFYRVAFCLYSLRVPIIPNIINKLFVRIMMSCQIGIGARLGDNIDLGYGGLGCVIHHRSIIGNNVRIGTNVTIGGTSNLDQVPQIGDNCVLSTGSKILGPVVIGKNSVIGANAVVITDIPPNSVAVGVPAKVVKSNITIGEY